VRARTAIVGGLGIAIALGAQVPAAAEIPELSWRLQALSTPELRSASAAEQGEAVSLVPRGAGSLLRDGSSLVVEIRVSGETSTRAAGLADAGAEVIGRSPPNNIITASVNEPELRDVARAPGVEWVGEQITPMTGHAGDDDSSSGTINTCGTGIVSEGNTQLRAGLARTQFDVDGTNVRVGVLSDSYDTRPTGINAADDVASGDLPGAGNPCGRTTPVQVLEDLPDTVDTNPIDEGRAMLQIVHDLAPGSPLSFVTAFTGQTQFGDNIRALANAGAEVIVDDVIYFREPMYQDGVIAKAVNDVTAQGVAYFSMAFNNNGLGFNSYEAPDGYRTSTCPADVLPLRGGGADSCMDFDPGAGIDTTFQVTAAASSPLRLSLAWAEARFGVATDFDLYVFEQTTEGAIQLQAEENNLTSQDPTEFGSFTTNEAATDYQIVIRRFAGAGTPRLKFVSGDNGTNTITGTQAVTAPDVQGPTIFGHNGAQNAQTVAAVPQNDSNLVEPFSSRGPVTYLFGPVSGTTPAAALATPLNLTKPDVAATDRGANTFFGTDDAGTFRFSGTSAAAPHAAAVGALQLEANPTLTQAQVKNAQQATALAVGTPALPATTVGSGLIDAVAAINSLPPPAPVPTVTSGPGGPTPDTTPTFFWISTGDVKSFGCEVDGSTPVSCTAPYTSGTLAEGVHTFSVTASDYFNQAGTASLGFQIDLSGPVLQIVKGPKKRSLKRRGTFAFASEFGASFICRLDKHPAVPCISPLPLKVPRGRHTLRIQAIDALGNPGETEAYRWKVKREPFFGP